MRILTLILLTFTATLFTPRTAATEINDDQIQQFSQMALTCISQEYPNKISHMMKDSSDIANPKALTPIFYGCLDWHSAVHGHWLLIRLMRSHPDAEFVTKARAALNSSLTSENVAGEVAYISKNYRKSFERPYGIAWFMQLMTELREWDDADGKKWAAALQPLEQLFATRLKDWLTKLNYPIRSGTHSQTAFAFGLILDWSRTVGDIDMETALKGAIHQFYIKDRKCPIGYEPSGSDFLSPCLMEADLIRRILPPKKFGRWLNHFLPNIPRWSKKEWLPIGVVKDSTDGQLVHLDGVNLSRAWALEGIASGLPKRDRRKRALLKAAEAHKVSGLQAVSNSHYMASHWLASFATYLVTKRGMAD